MTRQVTKTISLRLPVALVQELERRGGPEHCSAGEIARRYVHERLSEGNRADVADRIADVEQRIQSRLDSLEAKLLQSVVTLLVDAGKASVEEAEQWVDENLR